MMDMMRWDTMLNGKGRMTRNKRRRESEEEDKRIKVIIWGIRQTLI